MVIENNDNDRILGDFEGGNPSRLTVPFTVPNGYLSQLAPHIMSMALDEERQLGMVKDNPFEVPTGYFDNLAQNITQKAIQKNKLNQGNGQNIKLSSVSRKMPYAIPQEYFEVKEPAIKKALVLPFNLNYNRRIAIPIFRFVAAAAFAIFILKTPDLSLFHKQKPQAEEYNKNDLDAKLNNLSDEELSKYMDTYQILGQPTEPSGSEIDNLSNIVENLQNLTDEELQQYLNENDTQRPIKGI